MKAAFEIPIFDSSYSHMPSRRLLSLKKSAAGKALGVPIKQFQRKEIPICILETIAQCAQGVVSRLSTFHAKARG
jgi:hypothetical protein